MGMFGTREVAPARAARSGNGNSIAQGCSLEGSFSFSGPLLLGGTLKGETIADGLIMIEAGAQLEGKIRAVTIIVHGVLSGDVEASESVEVAPGGKLEGRVVAPSIRIDADTLVTADLVISPSRKGAPATL